MSVLNEAADGDGADVTSRGSRLSQRNTYIHKGRSAQAGDIRNRSPDRFSDVAIRLRPKLATSDPDRIEDPNVLMIRPTYQSLSRRNHPRIHPQQPLNHRLTPGLLRNLPNHRIKRILPMLNPPTRQCPSTHPRPRNMPSHQHPPTLNTNRIRRQPKTHPRTLSPHAPRRAIPTIGAAGGPLARPSSEASLLPRTAEPQAPDQDRNALVAEPSGSPQSVVPDGMACLQQTFDRREFR